METDELPVLDQNVDFTQVPPIHQKRTIAFVNNFLMRTVSFLNAFASSCESRLMELECKLERVEASLLILESQLLSISWLDDKSGDGGNVSIGETENDEIKTLDLPVVETEPVVEDANTTVVVLDDDDDDDEQRHHSGGSRANEDPRFVKFFKMIQFGVPPAAVKLKMETEGLDSTVLDTPDKIIPGYDSTIFEKSTDSISS